MNRAEFESLYSAVAPRLQNFIARQVGNRETAADLLQDTFLRLLRSPPEVRTPPELTGYLYRTAHSVVIDHLRKQQRARWWNLLAARPVPAPPDRTSSALDEAFRQLSPRERTLLWLAYVEEMSHAEIAGVLQLESVSIRVLLFRARQKLATHLKSEVLA